MIRRIGPFDFVSPKDETSSYDFLTRATRACPFDGNEDLVACDRITLYSTKFAAFIKSPLDIGRRRRVMGYATPFGRALSKCTLFEDPAVLAHPRTLMPLAVVYDYQFSLTDVSCSSFGPSVNGESLWWRIADSRSFDLICRSFGQDSDVRAS